MTPSSATAASRCAALVLQPDDGYVLYSAGDGMIPAGVSMHGLRVVALCSLLLMVIGCDNGRISRREKQNEELKAQLDKDRVAHDLDLQSKCSKDARAWFNENWYRDNETTLLDFSNHYNKTFNKCFVTVEYHYHTREGHSWTNDMSLWDVYENVKYGYGRFAEDQIINFKDPKGAKDAVIACEVAGQKCTSIDQFNNLIRPYMNN